MSWIDWFYIIPVIFLFGITVVLSLLIVNVVNDTGIFSSDDNAQSVIDTTKQTILNFDNLGLFIIMGLSVFVLVSAYFVWNHPAFFIIGFFLLCIAVSVAATFSNAYETFSTTPQLNASTSEFTKIPFLIDKLPIYIAFMGMAAAVVAYIGYQRGAG